MSDGLVIWYVIMIMCDLGVGFFNHRCYEKYGNKISLVIAAWGYGLALIYSLMLMFLISAAT